NTQRHQPVVLGPNGATGTRTLLRGPLAEVLLLQVAEVLEHFRELFTIQVVVLVVNDVRGLKPDAAVLAVNQFAGINDASVRAFLISVGEKSLKGVASHCSLTSNSG